MHLSLILSILDKRPSYKKYCRPIREEKLIFFIYVFLNIPIKYSNKNNRKNLHKSVHVYLSTPRGEGGGEALIWII